MFGWLLVRLRFAVVLFWAAVALAAYLYLPPIGESTTSSISDVVPDSAPAVRAESQSDELAGSVEAPAMPDRPASGAPLAVSRFVPFVSVEQPASSKSKTTSPPPRALI